MIFFAVFGLLAVLGALGVILARTPVHSVLALVLNFLGLAALYLSLQAEFMAVIQLIIYAGAIMVLFLFVISLLSVRNVPTERSVGRLRGQGPAGFAVGGALAALLAGAALAGAGSLPAPAAAPSAFGSVAHFGRELLTTHVFAFELTAFVLMVAVVGVVVLVGRKQV